MAGYSLSPSAHTDLIRIWNYGLERHGLAQTNKYLDDFERHFERLAEQPYLYAAVDDIYPGYHRSVCGSDSVYYRITDDGVEIMRILGNQDTETWL